MFSAPSGRSDNTSDSQEENGNSVRIKLFFTVLTSKKGKKIGQNIPTFLSITPSKKKW